MSREVPASMTAAWHSEAKIGPMRPVVRATIQAQKLRTFTYDTAWAQGGSFERDKHVPGEFASMIFGDEGPIREIPNIISFSWERSREQDAASATLVLENNEATPIGSAGGPEFDQPGYYTYSRGNANTTRWGYTDNGWNGVFVPDMTVKTYEGYGSDPDQPPSKDPFLMPSGVWLIDKVTYGDGQITLEMRDLARLLLEQVTFPPAVPFAEYPLSWVSFQSRLVPGRNAIGGRWVDGLHRFGSASSSNEYYIDKGFTNLPYPHYVDSNGNVQGTKAKNVIEDWRDYNVNEGDLRPIWRSAGQDSHRSWAWWEFEADERMPVAAVRLRLAGGPYRVYVSIHNGQKWMGKKKIDYRPESGSGPGSVNIDARIPHIRSTIGDRFYPFELVFPRAYMAKKIRVTFTRLQESPIGEHPWSAGMREMKVYTADDISDLDFERDERVKLVGNYGDYTHIVKWVCAWAGWFWPSEESGMDFIKTGVGNDTTKQFVRWNVRDPAIVDGRVWGDFMRTGTTGVADLGVEMFDKKPMMDIINYVRDLVGFNFFIDETGGVVWRMPNLWEIGNYVSPSQVAGAPLGRGRFGRTSEVVTLDEEDTLLEYSTVLDSSNVRERIFVSNNVGGIGVVIKGYNPYPVGLRRVAGWSDQHFDSKLEAKIMAEMAAVRAMFTYRTGQATIPGYPAIQVDDQVRIYERETNETYYHYVLGIKSELNMETGEWTYDLQTHWLGENPDNLWEMTRKNLSKEAKQYLAAIGYDPKNHEDNGD